MAQKQGYTQQFKVDFISGNSVVRRKYIRTNIPDYEKAHDRVCLAVEREIHTKAIECDFYAVY